MQTWPRRRTPSLSYGRSVRRSRTHRACGQCRPPRAVDTALPPRSSCRRPWPYAPRTAPMTDTDLASTIDAAWEGRESVSPATKGAWRDAVEAALDGMDEGTL